MVADIGEVKRYIKPKADGTLRNMRKEDLIEYIRCLENNYNVAVSFNENQAKYIESLDAVEVVRGQWIPVTEPPKERGCYIVTVQHWVDGKPVSREAYWNGADWLSCDKRHELTPRVTHWMPLPEPPETAG